MRSLPAFALLAWATVAGAEGAIEVDRQDIYYEVAGTTAHEILEDLRRHARRAGRAFFADARWHVSWRYDYDRSTPGVCRLRNLRLQLTQRTTLPRWNGAAAPAELVARWRQYLDAVRLHENGHQEHGARAAAEIQAALLRLRADDCDAFEARADAIGEAIIAQYADLDAKYDADTEHGLRQGAYWAVPPSGRR